MKLSEIKAILPTLNRIDFRLENGTNVPEHFHVTEVGSVEKHFIDCGGTVRHEKAISFQLWNADDTDHRLKPAKLLNIIALSESKLGLEDVEIEVEFQAETIGKYALAYDNEGFILINKATDCLAKDNCGIPTKSETIIEATACCAPNSKCC